jgi:hypothetical protein
LLAWSHYFRARAIAEALAAEEIRTASIRIDEHARVRHLLEVSQILGETAWNRLRPWLKAAAPARLQVMKGECR